MTKRILMFAWFVAFAICTFASRTPIYLNLKSATIIQYTIKGRFMNR